VRPRLLAPVALGAVLLVAAGCGSSKKSSSPPTTNATTGKTSSGGSSITAPASVKKAGKLVFCSDITYPPEESYQGTKPVGSDIDIGTDVARRMGVKARFDNTGFDGIIAALNSKKCDLIISGMNDTAARRKQIDFVDYIRVGQAIMVKKGNPEHIKKLPDLAGKSVSVELGTTNKDFLDKTSKTFRAQGKKAIDVTTFPKDTDAAAALKTGKVDAYFGDAPVVAYYIDKDPSFSFGINPVSPIPVGIGVRRSDTELKTAVKKAIDAMYADGKMKRILARYQMSATALKK
jgi:polar amino acid transport system substrate-binding protein